VLQTSDRTIQKTVHSGILSRSSVLHVAKPIPSQLLLVDLYVYVQKKSFSLRLISCQDENEMSGSRGEANFVWKCKSCKVFPTCSLSLMYKDNTDTPHRENRQQQSKQLQQHMSKAHHQNDRRFWSLIVEDWSLLSSSQRYVPYSFEYIQHVLARDTS
jgi:hypothetical protein